MKIPFSPPYIDESIIDEVVDTLRSGWITTGPKVKALEQEIKTYSQSEEVLCVNSWTSGAMLMLTWLGVKPGDEVIVPAYTYCATAHAVIHTGAKPVMVDSGEDFNISVDAIRKAITPRTKAILPVDIGGFPCDYPAIMQLVNEPEIKAMFVPDNEVQRQLGRILVVSDSAHSLGAKLPHGGRSDVAIFSLHAVKNVTSAEGGAICLNLPAPFDNAAVYSELRLNTLNCQTKDAFTKSQAGGWKYDIVGLGMKINLPDVNAAIALAQMRIYPQLLERRKEVFQAYERGFADCDWMVMPPSVTENGVESSYHLLALRIKGITEEQRNDIIAEVAKAEVAVNVHYVPLPMLTYFRELGYQMEDYPKAFANYCSEISLPIYPQLTDEQVNYIVNCMKEAYAKVVKGE
ncbi:MAG: DegT/DnrJ/EryC1/StrS family aminotransferase [Bacteroidaceae bacterium]|nr:DegT/DnrJ/EryC1/StrS family aminotransferase [Bacteroidaceae bacterium]